MILRTTSKAIKDILEGSSCEEDLIEEIDGLYKALHDYNISMDELREAILQFGMRNHAILDVELSKMLDYDDALLDEHTIKKAKYNHKCNMLLQSRRYKTRLKSKRQYKTYLRPRVIRRIP